MFFFCVYWKVYQSEIKVNVLMLVKVLVFILSDLKSALSSKVSPCFEWLGNQPPINDILLSIMFRF